MNRFRFAAAWDPGLQRQHRGVLALRIPEDQRAAVLEMVREMREELAREMEPATAYDLEVVVSRRKRGRSPNQNAMMWALYTIEATEQNGGRTGRDAVTPEQLYLADIWEHAPQFTARVPVVEAWRLDEWHVAPIGDPGSDGIGTYRVAMGTSTFSAAEMSAWLDRQLDRLAEAGAHQDGSEALRLWREHQMSKCRARVVPFAGCRPTEEQYKAAVMPCEACGPMGHGRAGTSLAHIMGRGMGGRAADWKGRPENWLHLCDRCHAILDNGRGPGAFADRYPHLKYRIENAEKLAKEAACKTDN